MYWARLDKEWPFTRVVTQFSHVGWISAVVSHMVKHAKLHKALVTSPFDPFVYIANVNLYFFILPLSLMVSVATFVFDESFQCTCYGWHICVRNDVDLFCDLKSYRSETYLHKVQKSHPSDR